MATRHGSKGKSRKEHSEQTKAKLLDAAEQIYAELGPHNLTVRNIAHRAGTTVQPIYSFFGGLDALTNEMFARAIREVELILDANAELSSAVDDSRGRQHRAALWSGGARGYRQYCRQYPGRFRILQTAGQDIDAPEAAELQMRVIDRLTELSLPATEEPSGLLNSRLRVALSCIHGFIQAESTGFLPEEDADRLFDELIGRLSVPADDLAALLSTDTKAVPQ